MRLMIRVFPENDDLAKSLNARLVRREITVHGPTGAYQRMAWVLPEDANTKNPSRMAQFDLFDDKAYPARKLEDDETAIGGSKFDMDGKTYSVKVDDPKSDKEKTTVYLGNEKVYEAEGMFAVEGLKHRIREAVPQREELPPEWARAAEGLKFKSGEEKYSIHFEWRNGKKEIQILDSKGHVKTGMSYGKSDSKLTIADLRGFFGLPVDGELKVNPANKQTNELKKVLEAMGLGELEHQIKICEARLANKNLDGAMRNGLNKIISQYRDVLDRKKKDLKVWDAEVDIAAQDALREKPETRKNDVNEESSRRHGHDKKDVDEIDSIEDKEAGTRAVLMKYNTGHNAGQYGIRVDDTDTGETVPLFEFFKDEATARAHFNKFNPNPANEKPSSKDNDGGHSLIDKIKITKVSKRQIEFKYGDETYAVGARPDNAVALKTIQKDGRAWYSFGGKLGAGNASNATYRETVELAEALRKKYGKFDREKQMYEFSDSSKKETARSIKKSILYIVRDRLGKVMGMR